MDPRTARRTAFSIAILLAAVASPLAAQVPRVELDPELPPATARIVEIAIGAPAAVVTAGDTTIGAGQQVAGPLAHFGGTLILEGAVRGDVTAVGSLVYLRPGAKIDGDLTILGGSFYSTTMAEVSGRTTWLREEPVEVVTLAPGRLRVEYEPPPGPGFPIEPKGLAGVVLHSYNGVDGLVFGLEAGLRERKEGPRTELAGGPVFRSERDDVGWRVSGLREIPGTGGLVVGAGTHRVTVSPEAWHRGNTGNSLAALFLADDDRTYHERTGYELWVEKPFPVAALVVRATWNDDAFESLESVQPFAFFGDDDDWLENPNPPIAEGRGRALGATVVFDRRDDPSWPTRGLWAEGRVEHWGFGGDFEFDWGQAQARAYLPIPTTPGSFVGLRAMGGGRLGSGDTLAPQFLYRLGGGSTVPGYDAFNPFLTGDRMAFATATVHQGLVGGKTRLFLVGIASVGDAWFEDQDVEWNAGLGGGLAIHGTLRYAGLFAVYGVEEEQWQVYTRLKPWF